MPGISRTVPLRANLTDEPRIIDHRDHVSYHTCITSMTACLFPNVFPLSNFAVVFSWPFIQKLEIRSYLLMNFQILLESKRKLSSVS